MNTNELKIVLLGPWSVNWASDYINYDKDIQDSKCSLFREAIIKMLKRASNFGVEHKECNSL